MSTAHTGKRRRGHTPPTKGQFAADVVGLSPATTPPANYSDHSAANRPFSLRRQSGPKHDDYSARHSWSKALWRELPAALTVRLVRFRVEVRGFRTQHVVLVTTLLDAKAYPDAAIAALYRRRWQVELCFRDIKTTLGLDVLRCQSPALIEKEIWLHALAYNLVRALMVEAAWTHGVELDRLSFKGTVDTLRQWAPLFATGTRADQIRRTALLRLIATDQVPARPNRSEPRARKRRPKCYQMLTRPRHQMVVSPSRARK